MLTLSVCIWNMCIVNSVRLLVIPISIILVYWYDGPRSLSLSFTYVCKSF